MKARWTKEEEDNLAKAYPDTPMYKLCEMFERNKNSIGRKARRMGLKKSPEYLAGPFSEKMAPGTIRGEKGRFKKGLTPWNKGIKFNAGGRSAETRFKKGNTDNCAPIGTQRYSKEGYAEIKVKQPNKWELAQRVVWEKHNGKIPKGHVIVFKDGNKENIDISNLELISRVELMKRNSIQRYPPELINVMHTVGKLKRLIREKNSEKRD